LLFKKVNRKLGENRMSDTAKIEKEIKRKKTRIIPYVIFTLLITISAMWLLSSINESPNTLTDKQLYQIIQKEQHIINKYHSKNFDAFNKAKDSISEDLSNFLETSKNKMKADDELRKIIATNPNTPAKILKILSYTKARSGVASNKKTSSQILHRLSNDVDEEVRSSVAGNSSAPLDVIQNLFSDNEKNVKVELAKNLKAPKSILLNLAAENDPEISLSLASNPNIPIQLLNKFIQGEGGGLFNSCDLLINSFSNPILNSDKLEESVNNENLCIRKGIALNPNTSQKCLDILSKDKKKSVRNAVAQNIRTESTILEYIVKTEEDGWLPTPRDCAFSNPNMSTQLMKDYYKIEDDEIRANIAMNPSSPESVLNSLYKNNDKTISKALARNPSCPVEILLALSKHKKVRMYVAENPNCSSDILLSLLDSSDDEAGIEGFVDEISGFAGINPTLLIKLGKGLVDDKEKSEVKEYINMVFADNIFSESVLSEKVDEIYKKNIEVLRQDLNANANEMLVEMSTDLSSNPEIMNTKLIINEANLTGNFQNSLDEISSDLELSSTILTITGASLIIYDIIDLLVLPIVQKIAASAATKTTTLAASASEGDWKTTTLKIAIHVAIQIAVEMYAEYQLEKRIESELNQIKKAILTGDGKNKGILVELDAIYDSYTDKMNNSIINAIKKSIYIYS
jgi:hypothetical protein